MVSSSFYRSIFYNPKSFTSYLFITSDRYNVVDNAKMSILLLNVTLIFFIDHFESSLREMSFSSKLVSTQGHLEFGHEERNLFLAIVLGNAIPASIPVLIPENADTEYRFSWKNTGINTENFILEFLRKFSNFFC